MGRKKKVISITIPEELHLFIKDYLKDTSKSVSSLLCEQVLKLSSSLDDQRMEVDQNELIRNEFEPKRSFRFVLDFPGIKSFLIKSLSIPEMSVDNNRFVSSGSFVAEVYSADNIELDLLSVIGPTKSRRDAVLSFLSGDGVVIGKWLLNNVEIENKLNSQFLDYCNDDVLIWRLTFVCDNVDVRF